MFGILATPLGWLLTQLYSIIGNYGICLIIVTVIVKMALYPLYKKQILSTAGMTNIQPKMQEIQRKYANDKETMNQKMSELYKEEGFNPMGGCLPMIVQMIVIMGLFGLLRNPMLYMSDEGMYFAIHERFLWIKDLSQPDLWILPIAAGIATFFSFWLNQQTNPNPQNSNMMMKMMNYFFPIMIVWLARSYPSGLAIYWFMSQFMQIFFNLRFNQIRKALNEKNKAAKKKKKK
ncbi:MAG: YidC/Oxa1 family membrane protein insertase [Lachnospiraceae bacterium]|nr:YidC/Oxa1 family membrane protein insertase [Lachnospiraceae bacterium]